MKMRCKGSYVHVIFDQKDVYSERYLLCKSMGWFLYVRDLRHERVKLTMKTPE